MRIFFSILVIISSFISSNTMCATLSLQIDSDPDSATVLMNYRPVGITPCILPAIRQRDFVISIIKANHVPFLTQFRVTHGAFRFSPELVPVADANRMDNFIRKRDRYETWTLLSGFTLFSIGYLMHRKASRLYQQYQSGQVLNGYSDKLQDVLDTATLAERTAFTGAGIIGLCSISNALPVIRHVPYQGIHRFEYDKRLQIKQRRRSVLTATTYFACGLFASYMARDMQYREFYRPGHPGYLDQHNYDSMKYLSNTLYTLSVLEVLHAIYFEVTMPQPEQYIEIEMIRLE
ncbi:PEGA domain-containing protein [candidate division KSB1 bacterium]|nr:PEGA domain-containing protein [candidate division KSB1 bacterium]